MLCAIKRGDRQGAALTVDEEQYIQEFARSMVEELLRDPECQAACDRLYESRWAHRFD